MDELDWCELVGDSADDLKAVAERMPLGVNRDEVVRIATRLHDASLDTVVFAVSTEDS